MRPTKSLSPFLLFPTGKFKERPASERIMFDLRGSNCINIKAKHSNILRVGGGGEQRGNTGKFQGSLLSEFVQGKL